MTAPPAIPGPPDARAVKWARRRERRAVRRDIAATRDLSPAGSDATALARAVLALLDERGLTAGCTVTLYESFAGEPPTEATLAALAARGIRVLVPITLADLDLDWCDVADPARTPLGKDAVGRADLALVPGLSVDGRGVRLGQGGGCYDKALPRLRPGTEIVVLLHPGEVVDDPLPRDPHDALVDAVVTAQGYAALRTSASPAG